MGCTPEGWTVLGRVITLLFMEGTKTTDYPTEGVCLVLEVTPLTTNANLSEGFPLVVEDTREPEAYPTFGTVVTGLEG